MKFTCPNCRKEFAFNAESAGPHGRCPACNAAIIAPERSRNSIVADADSLTTDDAGNAADPTTSPSGPHSTTAQTPRPLPAPQSPDMSKVITEPDNITPSHNAATPVPPPLPIEGEALFTLPDTLWKRLTYCTEKERRDLSSLILGAAIIGLFAGFFWGGVLDPWHGEKKAFTAILNLLLFGGWGIAEVLGLLLARNFKLAKHQGGLLLASGLFGGVWVALWSALDMIFEPISLLPVAINMAIGGLVGLIIGGGISIFSALRISKTIFIPGETIAHRPFRPAQRAPAAAASASTSRLKIVLWIAGGCVLAIIFGELVIGGLAYKTLDTLKDAQEKFEIERLTLEPVSPIPYAVASTDENLLLNGEFQHLDGWKRYELKTSDDVTDLKTGPNYVVWTRTNSREESGALGVYQNNLHIDLSGAEQILLDFDVWVGGQTRIGEGEWTDVAGIAGEMPVHVEITYLDRHGETFLWDRGFLIYGFTLAKNAETIEKAVWTHITLDLLDDTIRLNPKGDLLPPPTTITKVMVYGNGWNFSGAVGKLSIKNKSM